MSLQRACTIPFLLCCQILACASPPTGDADQAQLEQLLAREADPLAEIALESPSGRFTARVAARTPGVFSPSEGDVVPVVGDKRAPAPQACGFLTQVHDLPGAPRGPAPSRATLSSPLTGSIRWAAAWVC